MCRGLESTVSRSRQGVFPVSKKTFVGPQYGPLPSVKGSEVWAPVLSVVCTLTWRPIPGDYRTIGSTSDCTVQGHLAEHTSNGKRSRVGFGSLCGIRPQLHKRIVINEGSHKGAHNPRVVIAFLRRRASEAENRMSFSVLGHLCEQSSVDLCLWPPWAPRWIARL